MTEESYLTGYTDDIATVITTWDRRSPKEAVSRNFIGHSDIADIADILKTQK